MPQTITPIAHIHNGYQDKFGIPRQSGLVEEVVSQLIFEAPYNTPDAFRGLEGFTHLWLIWGFSKARREGFSPTVRPPRLGGNTRMGVFATRSPFRPNSLGLSCVKLEKLEHHPQLGTVLYVRGADLMDGTPIYDVKPYLPFADSRPEATGGFSDSGLGHQLAVTIPEEMEALLPQEVRPALRGILAQDPRPSYQNDPERVYGVTYGGWNVRFKVADRLLTVVEVGKE
ncbi:MAG: tRNA (N6-threonylcarbamoyladenosine(37)-N6)-methyltransferase TrmO [Clostridia bacterium]|nr:tRNA (N6-threonylcarbamoyladenosine(37)-N6)-methyltransferase TrmO [Clostridia bacterium]